MPAGGSADGGRRGCRFPENRYTLTFTALVAVDVFLTLTHRQTSSPWSKDRANKTLRVEEMPREKNGTN